MDWSHFITDLRFDTIQLGLALMGILVVLPLMAYARYKMKPTVRVRFSSLRNVRKTRRTLKVRLVNLPFILRLATLFFLLIAFAHPYLEREVNRDRTDTGKRDKQEKKQDEYKKVEVATEGISIQLVIDRSGSMGVHPGRNGLKFNYMKFENSLLSKLDVVKIISKRFITGTEDTNDDDSYFTGRGNDLIGLYTFARYPFVACPLTLRHELLLDYISQLDFVKLREEDGTYIGYALERAILQIIETKSRAKEEDAYNIKSSIIILITDGEQIVRQEDSLDRHKSLLPSEAASLAGDNNIKIYTIAISPRQIYDERGTVIRSINTQFSTDEIRSTAETTGGKFYLAQDGDALMDIYKDINTLEKSIIPSKKELEVRVEKSKESKQIETEKVEFFQIFIWIGFMLFLIEIMLSTIYFRRIP